MKMNARVLMRIAAIVIAAGAIGWQWWGREHAQAPAADDAGSGATTASAAPPSSAAIASASSASQKPALPEKLTMGKLTLTACQLKRPHSAVTTPGFCASFPVPENRANPDSRTIELKLAIIKSDSAVPARDLVVYLAGGPGQSAVETYPEMTPAFAPLLKHHDLLLLDQRGTGGSHPLTCPDVEKKLDQFTDGAPTPEQMTNMIGRCAAEVEKTADPRYYTTTDAVADLEAVRQALGAPKLDLVGVSYGTRMAQHYAGAHPDSVRSIVLDGVVPNPLVLGESFAGALEHSLKLQSEACNAAPACKKRFGDWLATLHRLHAQLETEPAQQVTFADPYSYKSITRNLSADTLAGVVRFFSYSAATAALLPLAVDEAAHGNYAPLMGQAKLLTSGVSQSMQGGMQFSVVCSEDAPLLKPRPQDEGTILGSSMIDDLLAACKAWPHAAMPKDFHAPFRSSIPTLLISGERDPVTPPSNAAEVLKGLSNGRSLVVAGLGHAEAINAGCMPNLLNDFVENLQPKKLDAKCLKRIGPIPAFVDFNGPSP
jgi:pimeloyl-ACP methyl ester carboxylesterase